MPSIFEVHTGCCMFCKADMPNMPDIRTGKSSNGQLCSSPENTQGECIDGAAFVRGMSNRGFGAIILHIREGNPGDPIPE